MRLLLVLTLLTHDPARADNSTDQKEPEGEKQDRLTGSSESPAWGHPYTVYFMIGDYYNGMGVIIDPYTILADGRSSRFEVKDWNELHRAKVLVRAGKFDAEKFEPEEQWREICSYSRHPDYNDKSRENAYAVISLSEPFTMNQYVNAIPLAPPNFSPGAEPCVVAARGTQRLEAHKSKTLRQVTVKVKDCPSPHTSLICTDRAQCHNDDGGPLICQQGSRAVLAGIITHFPHKNCEARTHTIYANVATLPRDWLTQEIAKATKLCRPATF